MSTRRTVCPRAGAGDGGVVYVDHVWAGVVGGGVREGEHTWLRGHRRVSGETARTD